MSDSTTKHKLWVGLLSFIVLAILIIVLYVSSHPLVIRFEMAMDNNSLQAIKSINCSALPR